MSASSPDPAESADTVLYAWKAPVIAGNWQVVLDSSAAGGARIASTDLGAAKLTYAKPAPTDYFELTFIAEAGRPYRIWIRGNASGDSWANDAVFVQFNNSVNGSGTPIFRIGSTAAAELNLEDCSGCGLAGWGWQDNGWGANVFGPFVYFAKTGTQTIRIQTREDGLSIDQIVISGSAYLTKSPGVLKNDATILSETLR